MNVTCIKFTKGERSGQYGYFPNLEAEGYIKEGKAEYYDPVKDRKAKEVPEKASDIPKGFPMKERLDEAGITMQDLRILAEKGELQSVEGVGESAENKIKTLL